MIDASSMVKHWLHGRKKRVREKDATVSDSRNIRQLSKYGKQRDQAKSEKRRTGAKTDWNLETGSTARNLLMHTTR